MATTFWACQVLFFVLVHVARCSDDTTLQSLATLMQQQAATILMLQAKVNSLETSDQQQTSTIQKLETRADTKVSFTAHMREGVFNIGATNSPLIFDVVVTNVGAAYNANAGVFIAPFNGLYVFYAQLITNPDHGWMHWGILKSSTVLCENHLEPIHTFDKSSCAATVHLQKGDLVAVKRIEGTNDQVIRGIFPSFTGFLLNID